MSDDEIVEVHVASNPIEADMLQGILQEEGIPVILTKEEGVKMTMGPMASVPILVRAENLEAARATIAAALSGEFALEDDDDQDEAEPDA